MVDQATGASFGVAVGSLLAPRGNSFGSQPIPQAGEAGSQQLIDYLSMASSTPVAVLRTETPSDRGERYRIHGVQRIPAKQIGFLPSNRGGLGITPFHSHEIAADRMVNKTNLRRYNYAKVVVLGKHQAAVREANRLKCFDPLMPRYSDEIRYGCVTLTHFTHSQKLREDGDRSLYNKNQHIIKWKENDEEGLMMDAHGIMCAIYTEELLEDREACAAIMREDNVNAEISMKEDTMATFGLIDELLKNWVVAQKAEKAEAAKKEAKEAKGEVNEAAEKAKASSASAEPELSEYDFLVLAKNTIQGSNFNKEATLDLIRFRLAARHKVTEVLVGLGLGLGA